MTEARDFRVVAWWMLLCVVSVCNIALWFYLARTRQKQAGFDSDQRLQFILSACFVFGCAFRAWLPRADVQRIVLYDSWLSNVFIGRSVATLAELCFMGQIALCLRGFAAGHQSRSLIRLSSFIMPIIAFAECCSWYAVLTRNYLGNALEESTWTLAATLIAVACARLWVLSEGRVAQGFLGGAICSLAYVVFMVEVDVPMYLLRWHADEQVGRVYLSLGVGKSELWRQWVVTFSWNDWRQEVAWMTLYFSAAVWMSLGLAAISGRKTNSSPNQHRSTTILV